MTLTTSQTVEALTPGEIGCIAATLNDCSSQSDDATVDALQSVLYENVTRDWFKAGRIAYYIVHTLARTL